VRLNRLNPDMREPQTINDEIPEIEDSEYVTWAEYRFVQGQILLREMAESERSMPLPNRKAISDAKQPATNIDIWDAYKFCGWLSQMTQNQFGDDAQYRPKLPYDGKIRLVRFRVPKQYRPLAYFLSTGKWQRADQETSELMLKLAKKKDRGYLDADDIKQFPGTDLRLIDFLWVTYSDGKFGFSVQKQLWIEVGGKLDFGKNRKAAIAAFEKMSDRNGWRQNGNYISISEVTFDTSAPKGHLPWNFGIGGIIWVVEGGVCVSSLASRLGKYKL
jgi:hypothetical protein